MYMENLNLFVISGGPGAGKTTTLPELEKLGFPHVPEAARLIIQEQTQSRGNARCSRTAVSQILCAMRV